MCIDGVEMANLYLRGCKMSIVGVVVDGDVHPFADLEPCDCGEVCHDRIAQCGLCAHPELNPPVDQDAVDERKAEFPAILAPLLPKGKVGQETADWMCESCLDIHFMCDHAQWGDERTLTAIIRPPASNSLKRMDKLREWAEAQVGVDRALVESALFTAYFGDSDPKIPDLPNAKEKRLAWYSGAHRFVLVEL